VSLFSRNKAQWRVILDGLCRSKAQRDSDLCDSVLKPLEDFYRSYDEHRAFTMSLSPWALRRCQQVEARSGTPDPGT
jgi:hypothetical protein